MIIQRTTHPDGTTTLQALSMPGCTNIGEVVAEFGSYEVELAFFDEEPTLRDFDAWDIWDLGGES